MMSPTLHRTCPSRHLLSTLALCSLCLSTACSGSDDAASKDADKLKKSPPAFRARHKNLERKGYTVRDNDLNKDDKPDQWRILNPNDVLVRIEYDMNFDGTVDVWEYYSPEGTLLESEMDLDHDAAVDVVSHYRADGSVERKELAVEFKGVFTVFQFFDAAGVLLSVEQDEDGDSKIDRWDYYEEGRIARTGWDVDRDGKPDKFDDN